MFTKIEFTKVVTVLILDILALNRRCLRYRVCKVAETFLLL